MRAWDRGSSSRNPFDLGGERSDLACRRLVTRHFGDESSGAGGVREGDALANARSDRWRVIFGQCLGDLARNERAGSATVQNEPRNELGTEALSLLKEPQRLHARPAVER